VTSAFVDFSEKFGDHTLPATLQISMPTVQNLPATKQQFVKLIPFAITPK
jgi:hypothetical protein